MAVPERIGRFDIEGRIGGGAFATVWKARDEALDSDVAIKVLSENWLDSTDVRARFLAEARLLRRAESDRVVRVHDLGELEDGRPYLVMTFADRGTLSQRLADGRFSWRVATDVAIEIGKGLVVLHAAGVLHRDIKPSNILYRSTPGGGEQAMLGDLGLGKLLAEASMLTLAGGTPAYMAPEQAQPGAPVSVRTDVYGLASLLYRALTGRTTHSAASLAAVADPSRSAVAPPSTLIPDIPRALDAVVLRSLEPDPDRRHPDVRSFIADLRDVLEDRVPADDSTVAGTTRVNPVVDSTVPVARSTLLPGAPPRGPQPSTPPSGMPPHSTPLHSAPPHSTPPQGFRSSTPPQGFRPSTPPQGVPQHQSQVYGGQPPRPPVHTPPGQTPSGQTPSGPAAARPRRRRLLIALVATVVLFGLAGAAGVWYYLRQPVDVLNSSGEIQVSVPRPWAGESQDGWQPSALTGGTDKTQAPGLLVAESAGEFAQTRSTKPGIFVGLLPKGTKLSADKFRTAVTAAGCTEATPLPVQAPTVSVAQQCNTLLLNDFLVTTPSGRLAWVRIKKPTSDNTNPADILTKIHLNPHP
ncbi:serine/threonine-protein kinase [Labedaea rhizosphaerae]|nr:serine/threonine-protein kinase [Labedaea rhizosphaerae]